MLRAESGFAQIYLERENYIKRRKIERNNKDAKEEESRTISFLCEKRVAFMVAFMETKANGRT